MDQEWQIPSGLSELGRQAALALRDFLTEIGHGSPDGNRFYTPQDWAARGEEFAHDALLVITYDGGAPATVLNPDYLPVDYGNQLRAQLADRLAQIGVVLKPGTHWYAGIYPAATN